MIWTGSGGHGVFIIARLGRTSEDDVKSHPRDPAALLLGEHGVSMS